MGAVEIGDLISEQILILDEEKEATEESMVGKEGGNWIEGQRRLRKQKRKHVRD